MEPGEWKDVFLEYLSTEIVLVSQFVTSVTIVIALATLQ